MTRRVVCITSDKAREAVARWARGVPDGTTVEFRAPRRSLDQNGLMWARLQELSDAVEWHGQRLSPADWKTLLTASLRGCRFVPGIDPGTVVPLGLRTSEMTKAEMADLLTLMEAFAAERGIKFSDEASHAA